MPARKTSYAKGKLAENRIAVRLIRLGWVILARRYKTAYGEIDLVGLTERTVVACEVKFRKTLADGVLAVGVRQQRRIRDALAIFLQEHEELAAAHPFCRFDVIAVTDNEILHIPDAF